MGTTTNAILAYGYSLGGEDDWEVVELEDGASNPLWYDLDDDEGDGFVEAAHDQLARANGWAGYGEEGFDSERYSERSRIVDALGVKVVEHCSGEYPMFILAARQITARRGYPEAINDLTVDPTWDAKLAEACRALDLTPKQEHPAWLLASYWSA